MMTESLRLIMCVTAELKTKLQVATDRSVPLAWFDCGTKNGKGNISTAAIALILAHPGEPIFRGTTQ
jgi:hypothetical protein